MLFAFFISAWFIILALVLMPRHKFGISALNLTSRTMREQIVRLDTRVINKTLFKKILREVKIFNRLCIVMPCYRGVPKLYIEQLARLASNPLYTSQNTDPFARLMYLYACAILHKCINDENTRRQLLKNYILVLGWRDSIKKYKTPLKNIQRALFQYRKHASKLFLGAHSQFANKNDFDIEMEGEVQTFSTTLAPSYITYKTSQMRVKQTHDTVLNAMCFEVTCKSPIKFIWHTREKKTEVSISHTADTYFCTCPSRALGIYVTQKKSFASSICSKRELLDIYISTQNSAKIFIIKGANKSEIISAISVIKARDNRLQYLLDNKDRANVAETERLFSIALCSHNISGENLAKRFKEATRLVPTLTLPSLAYKIETMQDFFAVVDNFPAIKRIANAGKNINVICIYSAQNDTAREIIEAYTNRTETRELIKSGAFVFFINKVNADMSAISLLHLMTRAPVTTKTPPLHDNKNIEILTSTCRSYPPTTTFFVRNTRARAETVRVHLPIESDLSVFKINNSSLICKSLTSNTSYSYALPRSSKIITLNGEILNRNEVIAQRVFVRLDLKLRALEEQEIKLIKKSGITPLKERKTAFFGSLTDISIHCHDKDFAKIFSLEIAQSHADSSLIKEVSRAIRNYNKQLLIALLESQSNMPHDIFALLAENVLGLRLVRGRVQLLPKISLIGDFDASFKYNDKEYNFTVRESGTGFVVRYNDTVQTNFAQLSV